MNNIDEDSIKLAEDLLSFINNSPTSFHVVKSSKEILIKSGYKELDLKSKWCLEVNKKYFVIKNDSSLIAFNTGRGMIEEGFKIVGAHTDSPALRIKPSPEINEKGYLKLNTEVYGSPILSTWFDRPLSIAGRIILSDGTEGSFNTKTELINIRKPIFIIPNVAIHMQRESSSNEKINPQKVLLPIMGITNGDTIDSKVISTLISKELGCSEEEIIDYDLFLYEYDKGTLAGMNNEFICSSRLDDLSMVHAALNALINKNPQRGISVAAFFDNEEIGSSTKQGADSNLLSSVLERISICLLGNRESFLISLEKSFAISADMAHSFHPNYPEKADITNTPLINNGPVIKISASHSYATESNTAAVYRNICKASGIPFQKFVNRSDMRGGSTISRFIEAHTNIQGMDVGNAMFAMHSIKETAGRLDQYYIQKSFETFYES